MSAKPIRSEESGILATQNSSHAELTPVPVHAVRMEDGFWRPRIAANRDRALPRLLEHLNEHGVIENFRIASGRSNAERRGPYFTDSDLYKWMEGAAWAMGNDELPELSETFDRITEELAAAQCQDGYLNTFFIHDLANQRWRNMPQEHELYCAGHLMQAAVAHYRSTGKTNLLDVAIRYADHLAGLFGYGKKQGKSGHEEIEMALIELYRTTGNGKYLELAGYFLDQLGVADQQTAEGHTVRAIYRLCGAADYYAETGNEKFGEALERLWQDVAYRKEYITGGLGSRYAAEALGDPYQLPNSRAYAETCAAIANAMWNWRLLNLRAEGRFADEMEIALYNGFLAGVSLEGTAYFYVNPLAARGGHHRREWYGCTCCPTNVVRMFSSLPGYFYSTGSDGLWAHLYDASRLKWNLRDGTGIEVVQKTAYPWSGAIEMEVNPEKASEFTLHLRIPSWSRGPRIAVQGQAIETGCEPGTYASIRRTWSPGDRVSLDFGMKSVPMTADPRIPEDRHCVAMQRGPLVYCLESTDHPGLNVLDLAAKPEGGYTETHREDLLNGITVIEGKGVTPSVSRGTGPLYAPLDQIQKEAFREVNLTFIPYYAWGNRGDSAMTVWVPRG